MMTQAQRKVEMRTYDRLPQEVRFYLSELPSPPTAISVQKQIQEHGLDPVLEALRTWT